MPQVKFSDGTIVNFNKAPSPQDVQQVWEKVKAGKAVQQQAQPQNLGERTGAEQLAGVEKIKSSISKGAEDISKSGILNKVKGVAEAGFGTVAGAAQTALAPVTAMASPIVKKVADTLTPALRQQNPELAKAYDAILPKVDAWAKAHPDATTLTGDIVNTLLLAVGGGVAESGVKKAVGEAFTPKALAGAKTDIVSATEKVKGKISKTLAPKTTDEKILEAITPDLSKSKASQLAKAGGAEVKKGTIFDTVGVKTTERMTKVKDAIKGIYNPDITYTENLNNIRTAIGTEAENLKSMISKVDHPYTFKELNAKLNSVDLPISFKNDAAQAKTLKDITSAAMKISQESGGKISSLLDARKQFDTLVEENFPNLYDKGKPTNTYYAVTRTRNAINDFIEANLPKDANFKASLQKQSLMYDAMDSLAPKAGEEVGTKSNVLLRKIKKFSKTPTGKTITTGLSGGAAIEGIKRVTTGSF